MLSVEVTQTLGEVPLVPLEPEVPLDPLVPDAPLVPELPLVPEVPLVPAVPLIACCWKESTYCPVIWRAVLVPSTKVNAEMIRAFAPNEELDTKYKPHAVGSVGLSILRYQDPPAELCVTNELKKLYQLALGIIEVKCI
jgi:hypothetical protein